MKSIISELNKAFESRVRLGIMSVLSVNELVSFNELKELLELTDGNLASHIKALEGFEYIASQKQFINKKPNTKYMITDLGRLKFQEHLNALEKLLR